MKYDKSLEQVWKWKESIFNRVKKFPIKKQLDYIEEQAKQVEKKFSVRLKKIH